MYIDAIKMHQRRVGGHEEQSEAGASGDGQRGEWEAISLSLKTQQQVVHVVGWCVFKVAMAAFKRPEATRTGFQSRVCHGIDAIQYLSAKHALEDVGAGGAKWYDYSVVSHLLSEVYPSFICVMCVFLK